MDLVKGLDRAVVALDEDRERRHFVGSSRVEHHLPDAAVRRPDSAVRASPPSTAARVDHVDDVPHAGPLVVGDVLDPDEVEDVVEVAPVLEHPLWPVDPDGRRGAEVDCQVPSVGGAGTRRLLRQLRAVRVLPGCDRPSEP